ncbi:MAG TPA: FHA domain-containing protein, partial [Candidatus Coprenecus pullistercoris]|nr:FHA domain-containing protein [Candidatus Coprenecus pullistercoris]
MKLIVIGRNPKQAGIIIPNEYISNYHAEIIQLDNGGMFIVDKSTNGTYLNGMRLTPGKETAVRRGDNVCFTDYRIPLDWSQVPEIKIPEGVRQTISIGSHHANTVVVNGSLISHFHATIRQMNDGKWYICDHSMNGTTVNGKALPKNKYVPLRGGDEIS